jgi:site-specific DNA recombinase
MAPRTRRGWPGIEPGHTFKAGDLAGKPAALYCRVSSNPDETEQKSVSDQKAEGMAWASRLSVQAAPSDVFEDDDRSASTFATKQRENFKLLREGIAAGRYKIVWFWATSRQTRGDIPLDVLAEESANHGVLWCVNGQLLNPANGDDHLFLTINYIMDRQYSWRISKDSQRGLNSIANVGKPTGKAPYGYKREYERDASGQPVMVRGRPKFVRDVPNVYDGNGRPIENSPAYVVREIYDRIAAGDSASKIALSLENRGILIPRRPRKYADQPCRWRFHTVLYIATNPAYIAKRTHRRESWRVADRHAAILPGVEAQWDPLVGEEQWWAVQRILSDPSRLKWRPGKGQHLLSGVARCGECGDPLYVHIDTRRRIDPYYVCHRRGHVGVREDWLDAYVEDRLVSWAADEKVHAHLWGAREDDNAVAAGARGEVERLKYLIEEARVKGEDPDEDGVFWGRRCVALEKKLRDAEQLARPAALSSVVAEMVGPDAADKWWELRQNNIPAAKQFIKAVADIRVHKGVHGGDRRRPAIDPGRISWAWLTGPGDHQPVFGEAIVRAHERAAEALRAAPEDSDRAIARRLDAGGRTVQLVRRELEDAGEIPVIRRRGRSGPVNHGYQPRPVT